MRRRLRYLSRSLLLAISFPVSLFSRERLVSGTVTVTEDPLPESLGYDKSALQDYATSIANEHGIPENYFLNFISAESSWRVSLPDAGKGAVGIVQIVPTDHPDVNPLDLYDAIAYAGGELASSYDRFGSWDVAFAAWNAGPGAVKKYGGVPPYPETQHYMQAILGGGNIHATEHTPKPWKCGARGFARITPITTPVHCARWEVEA